MGAAIAGFSLTAAAIHAFIGNPLLLYADMRSEKLRILDTYQKVALSASFGSSHVHNGFDPRAFDDALRGTPLQTKSLNLAISGGSQTEQRVMAKEFVSRLNPASNPSQACLVLLELGAGANFQPKDLVHPRTIDIYDFQTIGFALSLSDSSLGYRSEGGRAVFPLLAGVLHYANTGMLSNALLHRGLDQAALASESDDDRRGLEIPPPDDHEKLEVEQLLANQQTRPTSKPAPLLQGNSALIENLQAAARTDNIRYIYMVMPKVSDTAGYLDYPPLLETPGGTDVPIINLARPDRYPDLYHAELWHDPAHLNATGAVLLSRILATEITAWYSKQPTLSDCGNADRAIR